MLSQNLGTIRYNAHESVPATATWPSGLSAAPSELGLPENATVFELDQAAVLDFKQAVLDQHDVVPTCNRVPVHTDLLEGSRLVGEYFSGPWQESDVETSDEQQHAAWDLVRQAFLYGPAGVGPAAWLAGHGWTSCQVTTITELGSRRRRQAPSEFARASAPRVWLFDGTLVRAPRRAVPARPAIKALFTTASRLSTWWIHTDAPRP